MRAAAMPSVVFCRSRGADEAGVRGEVAGVDDEPAGEELFEDFGLSDPFARGSVGVSEVEPNAVDVHYRAAGSFATPMLSLTSVGWLRDLRPPCPSYAGGCSSSPRRVKGVPRVGVQGGESPMPAGGLACLDLPERASVQARTTCRMPPHQPAGTPERAVSPQRRFHKGASVVYYGSSWKAPGGKGARPP